MKYKKMKKKCPSQVLKVQGSVFKCFIPPTVKDNQLKIILKIEKRLIVSSLCVHCQKCCRSVYTVLTIPPISQSIRYVQY